MKNILFLLFLGYNCFSQVAGSLDTSFNFTGTSSRCNYGVPNQVIPNSSFFQFNDKIICLSINYTSCSITLTRFNGDGSIDNSFGTNGALVNTMCSVFINGGYYPYSMAIQSDNKIVIMGLQQNNTYPNAYWVVRLLPNGDLDQSFNGNGYLDLSFGTVQDRGRCIALQPDGKILVGGNTGDTAEFFSVARVNSNGTLDTTFGVNGLARTAFSALESTPNSIAVQTDGKIVLAGYTITSYAQDFALSRFNSNGTIDTTFGNNGKVITTVDFTDSDAISKILIEPDGKITAVGDTSFTNNPYTAMTRYLSDGSLDNTFGVSGIVLASNIMGTGPIFDRQIDGKYVIVGGYDSVTFEVFRFNHDGTLDSGFGTNGFVNPLPTTGIASSNVLIQPDNKIVIVGRGIIQNSYQDCTTVVRLNPGVLSTNNFAATSINLFPNPTENEVYFDNSKSQFINVAVYNCLGQEVEIQKVASTINEKIELNNLSSGVYVLKFSGENVNSIQKVIKR